MGLQEKANALSNEIFLGGDPDFFEYLGRLQLIVLIRNGLNPDSILLDVGCGCLRAGYWIIQFLNHNCYYGIEPNNKMLQAGIEKILEPYMLSEKKPSFDNKDTYDFSVFGKQFDFVFARSIWSHAPKKHIETMLDSFVNASHKGSIFLTSFHQAGLQIKKRKLLNPKNWFNIHSYYNPDYTGDEWLGRSHLSDIPGMVFHSFRWIQEQCDKRRLRVKILDQDIFGSQVWVKIEVP